MNKSESIVELAKALASFQEEVKQPMKDKDNPFFKSKYVPLENVVESITETAPKFGLSFVQWPLNDENGRVGVKTMVMHSSGEYIEFDPVFMNAEKNTPQGAGSLITYLKRYSLSAVFGITSDEDDDANESSGNNVQQQPKPATSKQVGTIKTMSMKFANARDRSVDDVYKALGISDLTQLNSSQASQAIKKLDGWLANVENKGA